MPHVCFLKTNFSSDVFSWEGTGMPTHRRRPTELHYQSFTHGDLRVKVGDFVLVRNDDAMDPEDHMNCFVAEIKDLFESDAKVPHNARVQWFSRVLELPPHFTRNLQNVDYQFEVVEDHRSEFSDIIDAESIFKKCFVVFMEEDYIENFKFSSHAKIPAFYCRYKFSGSAMLPKFDKGKRKLRKVNAENYHLLDHLDKVNTKDHLETESVGSPIQSSKDSKLPEEYDLKPLTIPILKINHVLNINESGNISLKKNGISKSLGDLDRVEKLLRSPENKISGGLPQELQFERAGSMTRKSKKKLNFVDDLKCEETPKKPLACSVRDIAIKSEANDSLTHAISEPKIKLTRRSLRKSVNEAKRIEKCETEPSKVSRIRNSKSATQSPSKESKTARRSLNFTSKEDKQDSDTVTTTRYGRKVKSVSNQMGSDIDALLSTPRKTVLTPRKRTSPRKNTKFYHSDESDDESMYAPSNVSSSGESEIFSDSIEDFSLRKKRSRISTKSLLKTPNSSAKMPCFRKKNQKTPTPGKSCQKTPSSRKKKVYDPATPTIPERHQPVKTPHSLLEESRQRLHVSAVPTSLPCREEEFSDIYSFIKSNLLNATGGCMYISGVPGTGKTATVHEVIRSLQKEQQRNRLPSFQYVEINGMKMTNPYQCYVQIFQELTGECIAPQQAANLLEKRFTQVGPRKEAVVLLVDELDKLYTKKQTVMYNLFDWPSKPFSKLIVVAIANTMDLPERMMMSRVASRLGLTRKTFQPYTFRELQEIVMSRIEELRVFDPDAVLLVAKKVAAVSGDARRALEICRRAVEVAEDGSVKVSPTKKKKVLVGIMHIDSVLNQMFSSPVIAAIRNCSILQKSIFKAILSEFQRTGSEETNLLKCYRQLIPLCRFEGLSYIPTTSDVSEMCVHLSSSGLLLLDNIRNDLCMKIRLNISVDDVNYALTGRQI